MTVAIDYDGTITSNYSFYGQLMKMLHKSGHAVIILTGCNPDRIDQVDWDLDRMGIHYDVLANRPVGVETGPASIGAWKKSVLIEEEVDMWFDNEVKNYEDAGVIFSDIPLQIVRA